MVGFLEAFLFCAACFLFLGSGADVTTVDAEVSSLTPKSSLFGEFDVMFMSEMMMVLVTLITCSKVRSSGSARPKATSTFQPTKCVRYTQTDLVNVVRSGRIIQLPQILRTVCEKETGAEGDTPSEDRCCELVQATMLGCVAHRYFAEAVDVFDAVEDYVGCGTVKLWGVLLHAAAKAERGGHGILFFKRLQAFGDLNTNDYMNVVRCYTISSDVSSFRNFLYDLKASGVRWDPRTREKALGACLCSDCFAFTEALVDIDLCGQEMDVRAFASQMKFSLLRDMPERCFELKALMEDRGVPASAFTYSLLLEAACRRQDLDAAADVLKNLNACDDSFGIINCTSLIESLVEAGMVREAEQTLHLLQCRGAAPFASCYEIVARGYRSAGLIRQSNALLACMQATRRSDGPRDRRPSIPCCS